VQGVADLLDSVRIFHGIQQNSQHHFVLHSWILLAQGSFLHLDVLPEDQWSSKVVCGIPQAPAAKI